MHMHGQQAAGKLREERDCAVDYVTEHKLGEKNLVGGAEEILERLEGELKRHNYHVQAYRCEEASAYIQSHLELKYGSVKTN